MEEIFGSPAKELSGDFARFARDVRELSDNGPQFYDVGIAHALTPGNFYELNLKPFGFGQFDMEFYSFQGPNGQGSSAPYAAGPLTVFDGCGDGNVGGCNNSVIAHFEVNGEGQAPVPEPVTLALLGVAFAGMGLARRRRQD